MIFFLNGPVKEKKQSSERKTEMIQWKKKKIFFYDYLWWLLKHVTQFDHGLIVDYQVISCVISYVPHSWFYSKFQWSWYEKKNYL